MPAIVCNRALVFLQEREDIRHATYVVVGSTLASREDSIVDTLLEILVVLTILAEEDQASTRATQRLVSMSNCQNGFQQKNGEVNRSRGGGHDVAVFERIGKLLRSDQTRGVGNISHQVRAVLVSDFAECGIVPVARVCGSTADQETRLENPGLLCKTFVVNQLCRGIEAVGERLKVDRRSRHLLLGSLLKV